MELQQSPLYSLYIKKLGWKVVPIQNTQLFIKKLPFMGGIAKFQRMYPLPPVELVIETCKKYQIRQAIVEASLEQNEEEFRLWCNSLREHVPLAQSPYLPTKTILVDINKPEEKIFGAFSEAKRRAVRRAQKKSVVIKESSNIDELISIKNKSAGFLGFITTHGVKEMWEVFAPRYATTIMALGPKRFNFGRHNNEKSLVGGILLIFWEDTAYYWITGTTKYGKKLFAPSLLVWEAIRLAKSRGAKYFDFVGVWDERFPKENKEWLGFTKFKEGFGGNVFYYPTHRKSK